MRKLRVRGGTTGQNNAYTGASREITFDTTKNTLVCHDGTTAGGIPLATEASLNTKQAADADLTAIAGLTPSNDDFLQRKAGAWAARAVADVKLDLGINNVDNTSDLSKPISNATQEALDDKADLAISLTTDSTATITPASQVRVLFLTAASLVASQTIDLTNLPDGERMFIYSTNGITALTTSGGTLVGTLSTLAAGASAVIYRADTSLIVGA